MVEEKISPEPIPESQLIVEPISKPTISEIPPKLADNRLKIILFSILGLVLVGVLVFAGYKFSQKQVQLGIAGPTPTPVAVATPTPDPTASWETYIDQRHAFSFKYPPDLVLRPLIQSDETEVIIFALDNKEKLLLSKLPNSQNMDLREFNEQVEFNDTKIEYESILINGYKALLMKTKWPCINECDPVQVKNEQYHVEFKGNKIIVGFKINTLDKVGSTSISDEKWLNQILSTFKFLPSASSDQKEEVGEKVFCDEPRPEVCTMECIINPPYICGSNDKSYCNKCAACADWKVDWYIIQSEPCGI